MTISSAELRLHPRVAQQGVSTSAAQKVLAGCLGRLQPFQGRATHSVVAALDWDHRLPSATMTLRLHLFYDEISRGRFDQAFDRRLAEIGARDLYPEFDVPDFGGLPADETYDGELSPLLELEGLRLTSPWRREVPEDDSERALAVVRQSPEFAVVAAATADRASHLGDLEAVSFTAPCESGHANWALDVWWLTAFDGRMGRGWSFLVDLKTQVILSHREFSIRAN